MKIIPKEKALLACHVGWASNQSPMWHIGWVYVSCGLPELPTVKTQATSSTITHKYPCFCSKYKEKHTTRIVQQEDDKMKK
jgi:hypothetical protein